MTLSTIQPIGKKPVTAPSTVARSDRFAGSVKMRMATRLATMRATIAAMWALTLLEAMSTSKVTTGSAAAMVDAVMLSPDLHPAARSGRSRDWIKSKNPAAPAVKREAEEDWGKGR